MLSQRTTPWGGVDWHSRQGTTTEPRYSNVPTTKSKWTRESSPPLVGPAAVWHAERQRLTRFRARETATQDTTGGDRR